MLHRLLLSAALTFLATPYPLRAQENDEPDDQALERSFYKGELGSPGAPDLENPHDAIFVGAGYYNIGGLLGEHYLRLTPSVSLHFAPLDKPLTLIFEGPINFDIGPMVADAIDNQRVAPDSALGQLRPADYDEAGDFLKFVRKVQLGRKEEKLYVNVGRLYGVSIGHGTVVRRYNPNLDPDRTRVGLQLDAYNDYGGFETFVADLAMQTRLMGALAFLKPLSLVSEAGIARSFSLGVHVTSDLHAPTQLLRRTDPAPAAGEPAQVLVDGAGFPRYDAAQVTVMGFDAEIKPLKVGNAVDLKLYGDFSRIDGAGGGITAGLLLRSNLGERPWLQALRLRLEGRRYDDNYAPEYFDSLYEVQKFQLVHSEPTGFEPTKYEAIVARPRTRSLTSVYGEASYALVDEVVLGVGLERVADLGTYNLLVHLEVPAFELLRLYASYQKLGFARLGDAFKVPQGGPFRFEPDVLLYAQARMMVLPILFINARVIQSYQWDPTLHGGSYAPSLDFLGEVQLGWEFGE
ncbi:MAG: hypothetical protein AAB426_07975 [Myxococcota bacterium]